MRVFIGIIGAIVSLGLVAVSMFMNFRFGQLQGANELDKLIYALAFVFGDGLKVILPFVFAWAVHERRYLAACVCVIGFAVTLPLSLSSSLGFAAQNRAFVAGEKSVQLARAKDLDAELERKRRAYEALSAVRAQPVILAEMAQMRGHRRWMSSSECTNATVRASIAFCGRYQALSEELVGAQSKARLDGEIAKLRMALGGARDQVAASGAALGDVDPQVSVLKLLLGADADATRIALIVLLAAFVEFGASFGFYLSLGHLKRRESGPERASELAKPIEAEILEPVSARLERPVSVSQARPVQISRKEVPAEELALAWGQARLLGEDGAHTVAAALHADYVAWCRSRDAEAMTATAFGRWLKAQGLEKSRRGGRIWYLNVRLKPSSAPLAIAAV